MSTELGPIQLLTFVSTTPHFGGGIAAELNRLVAKDTVRVLDALVLRKDKEGSVVPVRTNGMSDMSPDAPGAIIADLVGLRDGADSFDSAAAARIDQQAQLSGHPFNSDGDWDIIEKIPNDSVAVLLLLDHRWAIPLRDAISDEGGSALGDAWLDPRDLAAAGVVTVDADGDR
ncbi:MAG TPA: hypothetical protein VFY10_07530 [Dehalococcoidia bacterium]|nr:hypothetical protein [Dehalococcoidia bacterium]